jgi:hypothetical protein
MGAIGNDKSASGYQSLRLLRAHPSPARCDRQPHRENAACTPGIAPLSESKQPQTGPVPVCCGEDGAGDGRTQGGKAKFTTTTLAAATYNGDSNIAKSSADPAPKPKLQRFL